MKRAGFLLGSIALTLFGPVAWSQSAPVVQATSPAPETNPIVPYTAYNLAVSEGRLADAARHGALAWQLAEAKWGSSNPNTAGLAFNAAWSAALIGKSADRLDAARRAVELAPSAPNSFTVPEAQFLLGYAEYFATPLDGRERAAPKLALAALPVEGTWSDYLVINALLTSANFGANTARGRTTIDIANRALAVIDRLAPTDKNYRALALLARGQGRLASQQDPQEAIADFIQARIAYGPMRMADDPTWGKLAAWEVASRSVVASVDGISAAPGSRLSNRTRRPLAMMEAEMDIINARPGLPEIKTATCMGISRNRRIGNDISYPSGQADDWNVAGIVLRTDISPTGQAINVRLLGAVPYGPFSENALNSVRTWRYNVPENTPAACLTDRDIMVSFAIG
jgi:hypothetical protein